MYLLAAPRSSTAALVTALAFIVGTLVLISVVCLWIYKIHLPKQGWRSGDVRADPEGLAHRYDPEHSARVRGGAMIGMWGVSYPFATIDIDEHLATVRVGRTAVARRSEVLRVHPAKMGSGRMGVRFDTADGHLDPVLFAPGFFPTSVAVVEPLLATFASFGWPVDTSFADR